MRRLFLKEVLHLLKNAFCFRTVLLSAFLQRSIELTQQILLLARKVYWRFRQHVANNNSGSRRYYHQTQANDKEEIITGTGAKHKKLFDDNEGEYVDYEEIKE